MIRDTGRGTIINHQCRAPAWLLHRLKVGAFITLSVEGQYIICS